MEFMNSYINRFLELCGLENVTLYQLPGLIVIFIAILIVIYAFYSAVVSTLWPGEVSQNHIKYRILEED
jgi:hypothetical protein